MFAERLFVGHARLIHEIGDLREEFGKMIRYLRRVNARLIDEVQVSIAFVQAKLGHAQIAQIRVQALEIAYPREYRMIKWTT